MNTSTTYVAPRTCRVINEGGEPKPEGKDSAKPLANYADAAAYVLIAEPGAGKTTAFANEAATLGGFCETVRNFRTFQDKPEWHGTTLFLDGLDESRAGTQDGRTPLDDIRTKLDLLGRPRFRLSCRWADWQAANDKEALSDVSPDGNVVVIRLDPLSRANIKAILANNHGVEDTDGFSAAARERGVERLLSNPQNLKMLAKLVSQGQWPDSRKDMFEEACRMLVREDNKQHRAADPASTDEDSLIEAAGRLCAAQLLSSGAGYTLPDIATPDGDYPSVTEVNGTAGSHARKALGTRLFIGASEGKFAPAHRQIAEFLAARHVSGLVNAGLPLARVLALVTGFDGELLPSFQNFVSWLAVHNKPSRRRLSRLNPSGLIYAGDAQTYSADEKRDLVLNLRRESWNPSCSRSFSRLSGIGAIVSPEVEGTFRKVLTDAARAPEHQSYVMHLMQMLADGEPLPALSNLLEQMVRDPTWNQGVRCATLDALISYNARGQLGITKLMGMVAEIEDGSLDDPQDELMGILLKALYPRVLSIAEVQTHLKEPRFPDAGEYVDFWVHHVPRESTPEQLADLLDGIAARFEDYRRFLVGESGRRSQLGQLPVDLLGRVLRASRWSAATHRLHESGAEAAANGRHRVRWNVATERLYEWLGVVSDPGLEVPEWPKASVKSDLEWSSDALKALIVHGVETCLRTGDELTDLIDRRLFGARPLWGYGPWCLEMALAADEAKAASFYVRELSLCVIDKTRADAVTAEGVRTGLAANEALVKEFGEMVECWARAETPAERPIAPAAKTESRHDTAEQRAWQAQIAAQAQSLRAGHGAPQLLHRAAEAYLGIQQDNAGRKPRQRLGDLVGSREDLVDLLVAGIEGAIARKDLPSCDDVVRLFDRNQVNGLVLPFVAGLHSLEQSGRLSASDLNESQIRLAVTILYMLPRKFVGADGADGAGTYRPEWFRTVLRDDPALVADVLRRSAARKLETGIQLTRELRELADAEDHREVAAIASLPVLERFPHADTEAALMALCWTLTAALISCDWSEVGRAIEQRLGRTDLPPAERSCWLAAGYLVAPKTFQEDLRGLAEDEDSLKGLAMFVATGRFPQDFTRRFAADDFEPLVRVMGAARRLHGLPERAYWSTTDLIARLGGDPSVAATEALDALSSMSEAESWSPAIADAKKRQARKRREHEYRHSDIRRVVRTLDNLAPANAEDLAALVFDELNGLSRKIRDGSTSDWRQYWNVDGFKHPEKPRPEDECRDTVLSDLQERLVRLDIDAQPEGTYADDKRADIRVSFGGFNVPVEIKRSCHRDVWTAVRSQLIAKYTRDPGAAGYGIYLVFWFGDAEKCRPTKCSGWTPETAEDVRLRLEQSLDDQAGLISVCVVDVSAPPKP